ncbi:40-residue YVTN family beta-propeller repeat protein [Solimicrobium silvestre]|uniref:40-residue YVTN family beta-propeller repeat protein n=2 Tax=Solimicrobium silvestre TaxID=2099400 RepID=A0A2S9GX98_9BURK|nr:40-residue YVTN family beta-propeller repeat protein [Solimicrobium silvestre]
MKKISLFGLTLFATAAIFAAPEASTPNVATAPAIKSIVTVPGMPPVINPQNIYSENGANMFNPVVKDDLPRIYVPNLRSNDVTVIDPASLKVVDRFKVGYSPQHIVPSWDLRTLWVANNAEGRKDGSLTPIDPRTGKPGKALPVDDPYNLYFSPDGKSAIVVAEAMHRLDFRDPQTMKLQYAIDVPQCKGINHADFSIDGKYALFTCEFEGSIAKIDLVNRSVVGYLKLTMPSTRFKAVPTSTGPINPADTEICSSKKGMPQDIRSSPDGKRFYVADMEADGVHIIDGDAFTKIGFIATGVAAHGIYPSRDGKQFYVSNRGSHQIHGKPRGKGSVTVIDFASEKIVAQWPIPGGGSPDMGNVSANGKELWLSGRFDDEVYRFDTSNGQVTKIAVGKEPHGLTVWPQPGRYSLGHTGNLR